MLAAHYFGALLFFLGGVIYAILQTIISFRAYPSGSSISVCRARLSIAIIATIAFFPSILSQRSIYQKRKNVWFPGVLSAIMTVSLPVNAHDTIFLAVPILVNCHFP